MLIRFPHINGVDWGAYYDCAGANVNVAGGFVARVPHACVPRWPRVQPGNTPCTARAHLLTFRSHPVNIGPDPLR
jgi:hypothetical protein